MYIFVYSDPSIFMGLTDYVSKLFFRFYLLFFARVCVMCVSVHSSADYEEVRGLWAVGFLLSLWSLGTELRLAGLHSKCPSLMTHLVDLQLFLKFKCELNICKFCISLSTKQ